jgi:hypothetical protein
MKLAKVMVDHFNAGMTSAGCCISPISAVLSLLYKKFDINLGYH